MSSKPHVQPGVASKRRAAAPLKKYPPVAYAFILEGLNYAVEKIHGPPTEAQEVVARYLSRESLDLQALWERRESGRLDPEVSQAIEQAGGFERLNRHVSGQELCWGLRDWAMERWGLLAPVVLGTWRIAQTMDFGNIVFELIKHGRLQKEPHDRIEDFKDVFDFRDGFERAYRVEFDGAAHAE